MPFSNPHLRGFKHILIGSNQISSLHNIYEAILRNSHRRKTSSVVIQGTIFNFILFTIQQK